jgi:hypothetical protein
MGENKMLHILLLALAAITLTITTLLPSSLPIFSAEQKYPFTVEITGNGTATVSYDKIEKTFNETENLSFLSSVTDHEFLLYSLVVIFAVLIVLILILAWSIYQNRKFIQFIAPKQQMNSRNDKDE